MSSEDGVAAPLLVGKEGCFICKAAALPDTGAELRPAVMWLAYNKVMHVMDVTLQTFPEFQFHDHDCSLSLSFMIMTDRTISIHVHHCHLRIRNS